MAATRALLDALAAGAPRPIRAGLEGQARTVVAGRRMLVMLDNAASAAQVGRCCLAAATAWPPS
jgi:hypothetical protein